MSYTNCCTTPATGANCVTNAPGFVSCTTGDWHLGAGSPCIEAGTNRPWMDGDTDLDGRQRLLGLRVDIGCYEAWGLHQGASPIHYVSSAGNVVWPFTTWADAARVLQDAADTAGSGDEIQVVSGVYSAGVAVVNGMKHRVALTRPLTLRGVDGPDTTCIVGEGPIGPAAVRGAYLASGAALIGVTVSNGHTRASGSSTYERSGGGVLMEDGGVVSNCIVRCCEANLDGGGIRLGSGDVWSTRLEENQCGRDGGGAFGKGTVRLERSTLRANTAARYGGGALVSGKAVLNRCVLDANTANRGGGLLGDGDCQVRNSLLTGNRAVRGGGIAGNGLLLRNCTVASNRADDVGGGLYTEGPCQAQNGIVYFNTASDDAVANYWAAANPIEFVACCTRPIFGDHGIDADPRFVDSQAGNYRLRYGSPCLDGGIDLSADVLDDLDGRARPLDGDWDLAAQFDMGAYEYDPQAADSNGDGIPDWWCHGYGLDPNDPRLALRNADHDPCNNLDEYIADTDPTNAASYFRIVAISNTPPASVYFYSSSERYYTLSSAPDLTGGSWKDVPGCVDIRGTGGWQEMDDPKKVDIRFYRLRVRLP